MKITAFAHKDFYLLEVIALVLQYLRTRFEKYLSKKEDARRYLKAKDFSWVITVPAIWKHRGKQLMREAAYRVSMHTMDCSVFALVKFGPAFVPISVLLLLC